VLQCGLKACSQHMNWTPVLYTCISTGLFTLEVCKLNWTKLNLSSRTGVQFGFICALWIQLEYMYSELELNTVHVMWCLNPFTAAIRVMLHVGTSAYKRVNSYAYGNYITSTDLWWNLTNNSEFYLTFFSIAVCGTVVFHCAVAFTACCADDEC